MVKLVEKLLLISITAVALAMPIHGNAGKGSGGGGGGGGTPPPPPGPTVTMTSEAQLIPAGSNDVIFATQANHVLNGDTAAFPVVVRGEAFILNPFGGFMSPQHIAIHHRVGTIWNRQQLLGPPSDPRDNPGFAQSIALDLDTLIASISTNPCNTGGIVHGPYVYRRTQGVWIEVAHLVPNDIRGTDCGDYRYKVAVSGDTAIVGISSINPVRAPAAYVFQRSALGQWAQTKKITPSVQDPNLFPQGIVNFAFNGNTLAVSSGFGASVYERALGAWNFKTILTPGDRNLAGGAQHGVGFGTALAVSGDTILVGGSRDLFPNGNNNPIQFGAAYVFQRDSAGAWSQQAKLVPARRENLDQFGQKVSLSGNQALLPYQPASTRVGKASLFTRVGTQWTETLINSPGVPVERVDKVDAFAAAATVDGNTALIFRSFGEEFVYRITVTP